jgi:glutamyl-tRNA synthetase
MNPESRSFGDPASIAGRLAPSPTGAQHIGNARTYLLAWLSARSQGGRVIFRMEDIDSPRVKPWAAQQAIDDLRWLGLDWDEGPDLGGPHAPYVQTQRRARYSAVLEELIRAEAVYPCTCTRGDVAAAASAPHAGQEGPIYPGTCAGRRASEAQSLGDRPFSWRFRTAGLAPIAYVDRFRGPEACDLAARFGDFVVAKCDGTPAYQLAVVVDDHEMEINEVVRGDDLVPSAFRQLALYQFFNWRPPAFSHVPLVVGEDGRRLAKRHGDTRISLLRDNGVAPETLVGFLAWTCGLQTDTKPVSASELVPGFNWVAVPRTPFVMNAVYWSELSRRA